MKIRPFSFLLCVLCVFAVPSSAQTDMTAKAQGKVQNATLSRVVATVGSRNITRSDVIRAYAESDPRVLGSFLLDRYPKLQTEMRVSLVELCDRMFEQFPDRLEGIVQELMASEAIDQAAKQHKVMVDDREVTAAVHDSLETRRKSAELPAASDEELVRKLGDRMTRLRATMRRKLLTDRLVVADIERRLGHALTPDDFFRLKIIYVEAEITDKGRNFEAAKAKIEAAETEIKSGRKTFVQAAREYSTDGSRHNDGNLGVLPLTYLKTDIENALLKLKPGEMTAAVQAGNGWSLFLLEARGKTLTDDDRRKSLQFVCAVPKRIADALAWATKDIRWKTTIGSPPEWIRNGQ
jgi:hypothetical protein